jgi:hypothetical protein
LLVVELILRGAHHDTALSVMSSSWKSIVIRRCWDAAFERSLNMDSTRHSHSHPKDASKPVFFSVMVFILVLVIVIVLILDFRFVFVLVIAYILVLVIVLAIF